MVLPAVVVALVTSAVLYFNSPRFPFYQITTLRLLKFDVWNLLWRQTITATVEAEVEMENANFIWSQVHATAVDMYYPDWHGRIQLLGNLQDKHSHSHNYQRRTITSQTNDYIYFEIADEDSNGQRNHKDKVEEHTLRAVDSQSVDEPYFVTFSWKDTITTDTTVDKMLIAAPSKEKRKHTREKKIKNPNPVTMPPRSNVVMQDNIISVDRLSPSVYLNIVWDVLSTTKAPFGKFHMYNTGVAHVKALVAGSQLLAIPATVEVMCDNVIDTLVYPARVVDRVCTPVEVIPTWLDLESSRQMMGQKLIKRLQDHGSVLTQLDQVILATTPQGINERIVLESVEQWHDF
jgi:hypothetical protein